MDKHNQSISVVVPVFNEIGNIKQFHKEIEKTMSRCPALYEIIYVDDFSTDGTFEWLENLSDAHVKVIRKSGIRGKAFSLIQGFNIATGSIFVMIDGDLQYPPSKIPALIKELSDADVVVANREKYHDSFFRKFFSSGFKTVFGKFLFGLNTDIQSGMKAFTRGVFQTVNTKPVSPWTFDLEFLYRARQAGYIIKNVPITFARREHGESKVNVLNSTMEIGLNALYIKLKRTFYLPIQPENESMRGAGIRHKKRKYITHTTLPVNLSAIRTFSPLQALFFILTPFVLLFLFYLFPLQQPEV